MPLEATNDSALASNVSCPTWDRWSRAGEAIESFDTEEGIGNSSLRRSGLAMSLRDLFAVQGRPGSLR